MLRLALASKLPQCAEEADCMPSLPIKADDCASAAKIVDVDAEARQGLRTRPANATALTESVTG
jgi:hypothetical protein